jgi:hypothetical protein
MYRNNKWTNKKLYNCLSQTNIKVSETLIVYKYMINSHSTNRKNSGSSNHLTDQTVLQIRGAQSDELQSILLFNYDLLST